MIRSAIRAVTGSPAFAVAAVLPLALSLGFSVLLFSLVDGVLLRPLPYPDADRLVTLWHTDPSADVERTTVPPADFAAWQAGGRSFASMAAYYVTRGDVVASGRATSLELAHVTPRLFAVLGTTPVVGSLDPAELARRPSVVLGHELWQRRFGADPAVLGQPLRVDGASYEVVAVLPPGFDLPHGAAAWLPAPLAADAAAQHDRRYLRVVARLRPEATIPAAQSELDALMQSLARRYPSTHGGWRAAVVPLHEVVVGDAARPLLALLAAAAALLFLGGLNEANLLLARALSRRREAALRVALGAGRRRVLTHAVGEILPLAFVAGLLGIVLAYLALPLAVHAVPFDVPRLDEARIDLRAAAFGLALSTVVGLLLALVPASAALRDRPARVLRDSPRSTSASRRSRLTRHVMTAAQVALALVLLVASGLLVASVHSLLRVDPGFRSADRTTLQLTLPADRYADPSRRRAFVSEALGRLSALPGVEAAGAVTTLPLSGTTVAFQYRPRDGRPAPDGEVPVAGFDVATPGLFRALGIDLLEGRSFGDEDRAGGAPTLLVSRSLAARHWPRGDAVGRYVTVLWGDLAEETPRRIVGVVEDVRHESLDGEAAAALYVPYEQLPVRALRLVVHAAVPPAQLVETVRGAVHDLDPELPLSSALTLDELVASRLSRQRFTAFLLTAFAVVGLLVSMAGLYATMAFSTAQRHHEMGIRMALGADRRQVAGLIFTEALALTAGGLVAGGAASWLVVRGLGGLLYRVAAVQPGVYLAASLVLLVSALSASTPSAYRAANIEPVTALIRG